MEIFGIPIDNLSRNEILGRIDFFLKEPKFHRIATVNPEFLLLSQKNHEFRKALLDADLRIADGFGITVAHIFKGEMLKCRFPGADLMEEVLQIANDQELSVYLAVRQDGLSSYQETRDAIAKKYPHLEINGSDIDTIAPSSHSLIHDSIVLCNFGAPEQEIFLADLKVLPVGQGIRLSMGVGGSFDYINGKQKRAPKWLRAIGLEWLWRLIQQPKRWKRIWNATVIFLTKVMIQKNRLS